MEEGFVEAIDAERRRMAIRLLDSNRYCVAQMLGRYTPAPGERVRGPLHRIGSGFVTGESGETAVVSIIESGCSRDQALRLLRAP